MAPTLRTVTDLPGLGLSRLAGPDGRDRPVRWVAVSELEDPTPFLEGGELLLTTGMRLPGDDGDGSDVGDRDDVGDRGAGTAAGAVTDAYVERLVAARVAALGLGVGLTHAAAPAALLAAADRHGLPLVEVPAATAFIAVSKAVSGLLGAEEHEAITRAFEAQRDLTRAALAPEGAAAALAGRLARHVGGWVLVLDADGVPVVTAPTSAHARTGELAVRVAEPVARLRSRGLLASSSVGDSDGSLVLHPLGARGRVRGYLAVGTPLPLDRTGQSVVAVAVSLLSIAVEQGSGSGEAAAAEGLRSAALGLLLAGAAPADLPLAALGLDWLPARPVRVVVSTAADSAGVAVWARSEAGGPLVSVATDDGTVVVVPDRPESVAEVARLAEGHRSGGSGPVGADQLARGRRDALQALAAARGDRLLWHADVGGTGMLGALDPEAAASVAAALLAPLEGRKGDLVASVRAWLAHHGQWDAAAADLGVHRHTLRYRMRRVEELLGRSLDDPDLRAELWLALRVHSPEASVGQDPAAT